MAKRRITRSRTSSSASASTQTDASIDLTVKSVKTKKSGKKVKTTAGKRVAKIDAMKPKKPPTAFFFFFLEGKHSFAALQLNTFPTREDFRKEYQEQNPDVKSMRDIGKVCGEKWKTMTYEEKVQYYDIATEKRAQFGSAMANFIKRKECVEFDEDDSDFDDDSEFDGLKYNG
ncbi:hypothetical protein OROGR_000977 [Orobanche gracilis]